MGNQLCTGQDIVQARLPNIEVNIEKEGQIKQREVKEVCEASSFPLLNKHVEQRIKKITKIQHNPSKIWKIKHPNNIVYANTHQNQQQELPKGYLQLYKLKENGDFQGYFEGYLDQHFQPIINASSIFVFPNASYFKGSGENQGSYVNQVSKLSYSGGWQNQHPQGFGQQNNNKGKYKGQYNLGEKQGEGVFKWQDGATFQGSFTKGLFNGKGVLHDAKHNYTYEGQFKNGQKHGYGIEMQEQQIYQGFFYKGKRCGKGKLRVLNNDKTIKMMFQGNFYEGVPNGKGKISKPNIDVVEGIWEDGHLIAVQ